MRSGASSLVVDGIEIEYASAGSGPEALVLVHGNFGSWRWWTPVLERLPEGVRAFAPVLRGCGRTRAGGGDFTIARLTRDLLSFTDAVGIRRFHLVGHSLGGAVAMDVALTSPERLRSLTLVAPAPANGLASIKEGDTHLARILRLINPEHPPSMAALYTARLMSRLFGVHHFGVRLAIREVIPSSASVPDLDRLMEDAAAMTDEAFVGYLQALHGFDVSARLRELRCPTFVLAGGKDRIIPVAALERMITSVPRGELVVWPEAGHAPQLERPDDFAVLLWSFLRRSSWSLRAHDLLRSMSAAIARLAHHIARLWR
jgi:3-oxoadipate enol-lactonase